MLDSAVKWLRKPSHNAFGATLGATYPYKVSQVGVEMDDGTGERALGALDCLLVVQAVSRRRIRTLALVGMGARVWVPHPAGRERATTAAGLWMLPEMQESQTSTSRG
jgi:hypothetical protein